jgi:hypothetical protein
MPCLAEHLLRRLPYHKNAVNMDAILHIGLPKTATTFLQRWLAVNAQALSAHIGVLPGRFAHRIGVAAASHSRPEPRPDFDNIRRTSMDAVRSELVSISPVSNRLVISSEYFYLAKPTHARIVTEKLGLNVRAIICILRRQDRLIASGYAQDVKMLNRTDPLRIGGYTSLYDWEAFVGEWKKQFPNAKFRLHDFDSRRSDGSLLTCWKEALEIGSVATIDDFRKGGPINESLGAEGVELCRLANVEGYSLSDFALAAQRDGIVSTPFRLSDEQVVKLRETYGPANLKFLEEHYAAEFSHYAPDQWNIDSGDDFTGKMPEKAWLSLLRYGLEQASYRRKI